MITAVDTSVLLDVFTADPKFGAQSKEALRSCIASGGLVACEAVWAEVLSLFPTPDAGKQVMLRLGVEFSPLNLNAVLLASGAWKEYRKRGGRRERVAADFLIGAHASLSADQLLTRDRGFYRSYFSRLHVLDPSKP